MLIVQNITEAKTRGTNATTRFAGKEIGLTLGEIATIYKKGETLFYSQGPELPEKAGFEEILTRKVYFTQRRIQVALPPLWLKKYCKGLKKVKVYYTELGLFIKPYYGG